MSENQNLSSSVAVGIIKAVGVLLLLVAGFSILARGCSNLEDSTGHKVFGR